MAAATLDVDEVVLVLEGTARAGHPAGTAGGIRTVRAPGSGDDAIVQHVRTWAADGHQVMVVTADRGLTLPSRGGRRFVRRALLAHRADIRERMRRMATEFAAELWERRGPAPFYWLALPEHSCDLVRAEAAQASYGWGAIPVTARIGGTEWETSLLPKDGGYVLPVKVMVRMREGFGEDDTVVRKLCADDVQAPKYAF